MRLHAATLHYQTQHHTPALPPFALLWASGLLGRDERDRPRYESAYTALCLARSG